MKKHKKRMRKGGKIILAFIVIACIGITTVFVMQKYRKDHAETAVEETASSTAEATGEPVTTSASLFMVGDGLLHTTIDYDAMQADGSFDFSKQLHRVWDIAEPYDLQYYNQETILGGDDLGIHGYPAFNGPQAFGQQMVQHGFNLVSLANNHALDMGVTGITNSVNFWNSQPGVVTSGTYLSQADYDAIPVYEVNGITYSFISYTYGMNGLQPPEGQEYLVACYDGKTDELIAKIADARSRADVVIVAIHWGVEYQYEPSEEQKELAQKMADAGADIIIGNHPHVIEPIQRLNDHTICFYALGNLCAAQYTDSRIEMMAALTINKTTNPNGNVKISIDDVRADLMWEYYNDVTKKDFETVPFSQMTDDTYLPNHQAWYDKYVGYITEMDPEVKVGL